MYRPLLNAEPRATNAFIASIAAILCLLAIGGCQSTPAPFDPFLAGRTTIAPPATAMPAGQAPYYNGQPPTVSIPGGQTTIYTPPGTVPAAAPVTPAPSDGSGRFPRGISVPQSNHAPVEKDTQLAATGAVEPHTTRVEGEAIDAGEPAEAPLKFKNALAAEAKDRRVVPASHSQPVAQAPFRSGAPPAEPASRQVRSAAGWTNAEDKKAAAAANSAGGTAPGRLPELTDFPAADGSGSRAATEYGFDPGYAWLKGKLEYSHSRKRWKLRYIAVEGPTDDFGGSVVLPDAAKLAGFEAGDFVRIEGRVLEAPTSAKNFSPTYAIERIAKQQ